MEFPLSNDEKASFGGGTYKFKLFRGPLTLYRLGGRTYHNGAISQNRPDGRFWFDPELFWHIVDEITDNTDDQFPFTLLVKELVRDRLAICYDWNSLSGYFEFKLRAGEEIAVACGSAAPQSSFSVPKNKKDWTAERLQMRLDVSGAYAKLAIDQMMDDGRNAWLRGGGDQFVLDVAGFAARNRLNSDPTGKEFLERVKHYDQIAIGRRGNA